MKKVLFVSYFYPPIQSVESIMACNSIKYLDDFGWEPVVVSAKGFGEPIQRNLSNNKYETVKAKSFKNFLTKGLYSFKLVTDPEIGWLPFVISEIKKQVKLNDFDAVISRANPISSHLAVLFSGIHKDLPWIALFGDPGAQHPYIKYKPKFLKKAHEYVDQKIISRADKVIVTNKQTKLLFEDNYNNSEKIEILPNTYDDEKFNSFLNKKIPKEKSDKFIMTYTGSFYNLRSPEPFLKALKIFLEENPKSKEDIKVKFIGNMGEFKYLIRKYDLENWVYNVRNIPHNQALKELYNSNLLLLIDAPLEIESPFLPTKLVEYLIMRKPILGITPKKGSAADTIRETKTGEIVSPKDIKNIAKKIKYFYTNYKNGNLSINSNEKIIKKYSAKNYGIKLSKILNSIT